jgi:hypothetical protein
MPRVNTFRAQGTPPRYIPPGYRNAALFHRSPVWVTQAATELQLTSAPSREKPTPLALVSRLLTRPSALLHSYRDEHHRDTRERPDPRITGARADDRYRRQDPVMSGFRTGDGPQLRRGRVLARRRTASKQQATPNKVGPRLRSHCCKDDQRQRDAERVHA